MGNINEHGRSGGGALGSNACAAGGARYVQTAMNVCVMAGVSNIAFLITK
jgi:hypothetical protein